MDVNPGVRPAQPALRVPHVNPHSTPAIPGRRSVGNAAWPVNPLPPGGPGQRRLPMAPVVRGESAESVRGDGRSSIGKRRAQGKRSQGSERARHAALHARGQGGELARRAAPCAGSEGRKGGVREENVRRASGARRALDLLGVLTVAHRELDRSDVEHPAAQLGLDDLLCRALGPRQAARLGGRPDGGPGSPSAR
jgi:hypothetical protein